MQDKYVRFDWAIKRLLRQKANFCVLEGFLKVFLGDEIKIVELLESESNSTSADDKFNRVDIMAKNSKGEIIIVEVQNSREVYFLERLLYGCAKAITEHIKLGSEYKDVKKIYSIGIVYFDLGKGSDYLYVGQNDFIGVHTKDKLILTRKEDKTFRELTSADIFPTYYIIKVNNFDGVAKSSMAEWMLYLKDGIISQDAKAPGLQEAREKLLYYNMDDQEKRAYDNHINSIMMQNDMIGNSREEGKEEGRKEGLAEGRKEGLVEGEAIGRKRQKEETAKTLLNKGIPIDIIIESTGLTEQEVINLQRKVD